jgi:uncharacterized protein (DUF2267 family)
VIYGEFIGGVAERAGVSTDDAEALTHATLQTLADRISGGEAEDVAAGLPDVLQSLMLPPRAKQAERFGLDEFLRRVSDRAGVPAAQARDGARAVLTTVRETVEGEFEDVMMQLPREFEELVGPTASQE